MAPRSTSARPSFGAQVLFGLILLLPMTSLAKTPNGTKKATFDPSAVTITGVASPQGYRGDSLEIKGSKFPAGEDLNKIHIYLDSKKIGAPSAVSKNRDSVFYQIPDCQGVCRDGSKTCTETCESCASRTESIPECQDCRAFVEVGRHRLRVEVEGNPVPFPLGTITILKDSEDKPEITAIYPATSYPQVKSGENGDADDQQLGPPYELYIQGKGFSAYGCDNELIVGGAKVGNVCWDGDEACQASSNFIQARAISSRELALKNLRRDPEALPSVAIEVAGERSKPHAVALARVGREYPARVAAGVLAGLVVITIWIAFGLRRNKIAGKRYSIFTALVLDPESDTYSLSRFQFYVWTAVAIFGYIYLATSKSLVQNQLNFIDVPEGLPAIVFISAATSFIAQSIQSNKGPKGAGEVQPSWADFLSTGGVVAPERFQFFMWTILGALAFVALVLLREPGTVQDLPRVPDGFLALMGVSSAGYLGGKLARKPGPIIDEILAKYGSLQLTIRGRNLHNDATIRIGDMNLDLREATVTRVPDDQSSESGMNKAIEITLKTVLDAWQNATAPLLLTVINPDAQKAVWPFVVSPSITPGLNLTVKHKTKTPVMVTGAGFRQGATAHITVPPNIDAPKGAVQSITATQVSIDIDATQTAVTQDVDATLTLENPDTGAASVPLKITV